ncbi:MAG: NTP transferase domain-containing protein [Clostridium sp.]|nr:NTP transferase domain-containing protein [Clostridium sp.]
MANLDCAIVLAGGEGKRMKSNKPKVLSQVLFQPMLKWVVDAVLKADLENLCVVSGFMHECVENYLDELKEKEEQYRHICFAYQSERKGTAHAVMMADAFLKKHSGGNVLILNGDAPLVDEAVIRASYEQHKKEQNAVTVIAATLEDATGYGRVVRNPNTGALTAIVEQKDADEETLKIKEVNSGAYWFHIDDLLSVLYNIDNCNAQGEYYLPDAIQLLLKAGKKAGAYTANNANAVLGANDCMQLNHLNVIAREIILKQHMQNGVEIPCTDGVVIGPNVTFGKGNRILPTTLLIGNTAVGDSCVIGPNTVVSDSIIGNDVTLHNVHCIACNLEDHQSPTPFSTIQGN